ncbi:MAG: hypothetical protein E7055_14970 [Lentisphaerae bacterium]|nr:hypothetical protein [Lentisphaerota bacterium]
MRFQCPLCKGIVSAENSDMGNSVQCGHCGKPVTVPTSRTASGSVIGDFIILHELGRGGMGVVYLAHQISLDRPAALKILAENFAKNAEYVVGFIKEARAAAKLNHPNIVQAYAVGDDEGIFYFAMEHVNGETMSNILKRETKLKVDQAIDIIRQIAEALDYAWQEEKLVHRDIKPDNIMLTSSGRAKLADLGLAKVGNENSKAEGDEVMGTPQYISPEQLTGDTLDNRTDIYCLGATFYHFLTGRFPYEGATAVEIARQHLEGTLIPPSQIDPGIPEAVSNVVVKMMAKDPAQRYQSAGKLAEDLAMIKRGQNPGAGSPKVAAPKLHVPGKGASQTGAPSVSVPGKGVPKLTVPGSKPAGAPTLKKPSVAVKPQEQAEPQPAAAAPAAKRAVPKLVKREESPAPPPAEVTPAPAAKAKKKKKEKEGRSPVLKIIVGIVVVLLLAAAGAVCYFRFVKKQDPVALISQAKEVIRQQTAKPEPSEFMKAADPVIRKIRSQENPDPAANAKACYDFLRKRLAPETEEEKEFQREITAYFVQQDENATEEARMAAISRYEAELERKRHAAEAAAKARLEEERRARVRAAEQALAEAEKRRRDSERKKLQAQKDSYKRKFEVLERQLVLALVICGDKNDPEALKKIFEDSINIRSAVAINRPDYVSPAEFNAWTAPLINRARSLQKTMTGVWDWEKVFTDGDPLLKGRMIELNSYIYNLTEIKDGVLHAKAGAKTISVPVAKLVKDRKFLKFAVRAASDLHKKDSLPYYFFWHGAYRNGYEASLDASPGGRAAYSRFVTEYLKFAKQDAKARAQLPGKFRGVPEFEGKPRPAPAARRPAPKKPAAKKPAPKKPAPKKPAPKKK